MGPPNLIPTASHHHHNFTNTILSLLLRIAVLTALPGRIRSNRFSEIPTYRQERHSGTAHFAASGINQGAGTTTLFAGTICGWIENTSRLDGSTSTLTQCTLLRSFRSGCWASLVSTLSPKVSIRVKFSRRRKPVFTASGGSLS